MGPNAVYGIQAQEKVVYHLSDLLNGNQSMDYRHLHLICEHKELMLEKLIHLRNYYKIKELENLINNYQSIVQSFQHAKFLYLTQVIRENPQNGIYSYITNSQIIKEVTSIYSDETQREKEILDKILLTFH